MNHDDYPDAYIRSILADVKSIAMVGVTDSPVRASNIVARYLSGKGYRVYPINPKLAGTEIAGKIVLTRLADVPEPIDMVDIFRRPDAIAGVVEEALALEPKPKVIWLQLGLRDDAVAARAEAAGLRVVMNRCPKIEYGRLAGENQWAGINSRFVTTRKPVLAGGHQHFSLTAKQ
jgi:predicted CoA-binding protein